MTMTNKDQLGESERAKLVELAHKTLWESEGEPALRYLKEERSLSEPAIRRFKMGYVPLRVSHRCAGRLIFPIYDSYDNLVAISTRHLHKQKKEPGYFWHESFEKSFYLYGLSVAKKAILSCSKAILVEGEMDVAALHSKGVDIAVGVCGSSFSVFQAAMLSRYCSELYLMFDGDKSGMNALKRVEEMDDEYIFSDSGMKMIPCSLPLDMDPDDFVKQYGKTGVIDLLKISKEQFRE